MVILWRWGAPHAGAAAIPERAVNEPWNWLRVPSHPGRCHFSSILASWWANFPGRSAGGRRPYSAWIRFVKAQCRLISESTWRAKPSGWQFNRDARALWKWSLIQAPPSTELLDENSNNDDDDDDDNDVEATLSRCYPYPRSHLTRFIMELRSQKF